MGRRKKQAQEFTKTFQEFQERQTFKLPSGWKQEEVDEFLTLFIELIARDGEALALYESLPVAKNFHDSQAHENALSGSNRGGKTTGASAEVAMAATGQHPVKDKYPKRGIQIACVGLSQSHLTLMYKYLFEDGLFKVFFHPKELRWIVVVEDDPEHQRYRDFWQDAPPMIPQRFVVGEPSWENAREKIPISVTLVNGGMIRFYSGLAVALPQGWKFHLIWIDEELLDASNWLTELRARLVDYNGYLQWSATPQRATEEFRSMEIRANDPDNEKKPLAMQTRFFKMLSRDNKFISKTGRDAFEDKLVDDPEQLKIRVGGEFPYDTMLVYPDFKEKRNVIEPFTLLWNDTRYAFIDPGNEEAGILYVACLAPPTDKMKGKISEVEWAIRSKLDAMVCYDEDLIRNGNAQVVAQRMRSKLQTHSGVMLQDITIDERASRQTGIGMKGMVPTVARVHWEALVAEGINVKDNAGFRYGTADMDLGVNRTIMAIVPTEPDFMPKLFIFNTCRRLIYEFKSWRKKRNRQNVFTGYDEKNHTLLDCVRYAITRDLKWVEPPAPPPSEMTLVEIQKAIRQQRGQYRR